MADQILIPANLKARFTEIDQIAKVVGDVKAAIDTINNEHSQAAGTDDKIAKTYHEKTAQPMKDLSTLVQDVSTLLGIKAQDGVYAVTIFDNASEAATETAHSL